MKSVYIFIVGVALAGCTSTQNEPAHLYGQLGKSDAHEINMSYEGAESYLGKSKHLKLQSDNQGQIDTMINVGEGTYYKILNSTIYLEPGDELKFNLGPTATKTEFSGKSAEVNNYLKSITNVNPTYLKSGVNFRGDFETTSAMIDSMASARMKELHNLKNAGKYFIDMEEARIKGDVANSYLNYQKYARRVRLKEQIVMTPEEEKEELQKCLAAARPMIQALNNDRYLELPVVRAVMEHLYTDDEIGKYLSEGITASPYMNEMYETNKWVESLQFNVTPEHIQKANEFLHSMKYDKFAEELRIVIERANKLVQGAPAIDIEIKDEKGGIHKLSDFKGKIIYIDFWSTWCGPCIKESPFFESLAKEYAGKDVIFLQISLDTHMEILEKFMKKQKKELPQYNSTDPLIVDGWAINTIPRFIIIDKDFNIVNAYAPRPREDKAKEILDSLLK